MATKTPPRRRLPTSQILFGAIVMLVGVLLETTGVFETADVLLFVPTLFGEVSVTD